MTSRDGWDQLKGHRLHRQEEKKIQFLSDQQTNKKHRRPRGRTRKIKGNLTAIQMMLVLNGVKGQMYTHTFGAEQQLQPPSAGSTASGKTEGGPRSTGPQGPQAPALGQLTLNSTRCRVGVAVCGCPGPFCCSCTMPTG